MKLLKFYTPSCGPCKVMGPIVEKVAFECEVYLESIDASQEPEVAVKYGVRTVPMFILVDSDEQLVASTGGLMTEDTFSAWLEPLC